MKRFLKILSLLIVLFPVMSYAGFFSSLFGAKETIIEKKSECGRQIEIFKHFMHDGKICKQDDDCISMDGACPLGCKFYVNKNFEEIINTEMDKVLDKCEKPVCATKCPPINVKAVCKQNKCQARTK